MKFCGWETKERNLQNVKSQKILSFPLEGAAYLYEGIEEAKGDDDHSKDGSCDENDNDG